MLILDVIKLCADRGGDYFSVASPRSCNIAWSLLFSSENVQSLLQIIGPDNCHLFPLMPFVRGVLSYILDCCIYFIIINCSFSNQHMNIRDCRNNWRIAGSGQMLNCVPKNVMTQDKITAPPTHCCPTWSTYMHTYIGNFKYNERPDIILAFVKQPALFYLFSVVF